MDANKQIERLLGSISSLEESLRNLQSSAESLNELNIARGDSSGTNASDTRLDELKIAITERSKHLESVMATVLNPDNIQNSVNSLKKIQDRTNYWNERIGKK